MHLSRAGGARELGGGGLYFPLAAQSPRLSYGRSYWNTAFANRGCAEGGNGAGAGQEGVACCFSQAPRRWGVACRTAGGRSVACL